MKRQVRVAALSIALLAIALAACKGKGDEKKSGASDPAVESGIIGLAIFLILILLTLRIVWDLPPPQRRLWLILGTTWVVGVMNLSWQYRKPTWLLLALLVAHAAVTRSQSARPQEEQTV